MAQHDYVIANGTGAAVRSDLNNALAAIVSQNSGATEPATMYAYQWWADTTTGLLKLRNGANNAWITLRELDGTLTIEAGTVSAPGLAFASDLNTGVWSPGADQFAIATNGVERVEWGTSEVVFNDGGTNYDFRVEGDTNANLLFVDASADAVGIGTSSVQSQLSVLGPVGTLNDSGGTLLLATDAAGTDVSGALGAGVTFAQRWQPFSGAVRVAGIYGVKGSTTSNYGGSLAFYTQPVSSADMGERMRITAAGLVGIGVTAPSVLVHGAVSSGAANLRLESTANSGEAGLQLYGKNSGGTVRTATIKYDASDYFRIATASAVAIAFETSDAERARIDSSGRLLVGTSSSRGLATANAGSIQIESVNTYATASITTNSPDTNGAYLALGKSRGSSAGSNTIVNSGDEIGGILFAGANGSGTNYAATITAQIDATPGVNDMPGRLVFSVTADGSSSPTEAMRLENTGTMRVSGTIYRSGNSGIRFSGAAVIPQGSTGGNADNDIDLGLSGSRWRTIYAGTGTINTSDFNLKQDVEELDQAELSVAATIKGLIKKFRFTDAVAAKGNDARIHVGVIAQEVEQAFADEGLNPRRYGMFCEDTLEDGSKRLGIRYDELLAFVIAAT